MTTIAGLDALRAKAGVQERSDALASLRADFALIWKTHRAYGYVSEDERDDGVKAEGEMIRASLCNTEAMQAISALCQEAADAIRRDQSRAERIRAEVRADKQRRAA